VDTISFDIPDIPTPPATNPPSLSPKPTVSAPVPLIAPLKPLPPITDPVVIDGTTQPGGMVEVSGGGTVTNGLTISAGNSKLRGLVVNSFKGDGILLTSKGSNTIEGCFIGTDATGSLARGNRQSGVHALGSPDNLFGGTTEAARNIISGNRVGNDKVDFVSSGYGIWIDAGSTNNKVQGCFVGTDKSGTKSVPNGVGVVVGQSVGSSQTTSIPKLGAVIGGTTTSPGSAPGNLISGNANVGVAVSYSSGNTVVGNLIGFSKDGKTSLSNGNTGVYIFRSAGNTIGATSAAGRNVIGGGDYGVLLGGTQSSKNIVVGNFIGSGLNGTGGNGSASFGAKVGIGVVGASGNTIGGTSQGARNVICNNDNAGISIFADNTFKGPGNRSGSANNNRVSGNYIGVDASGRRAFGNKDVGVILLYEATGNIVENNVVAGSFIGVNLNSADGRVKGNTVRSNLIGTDASGTRPLPNKVGIGISGATGNTIQTNVIAGNSLVGLVLISEANENTVGGNRIGTNKAGTSAIGNGQYGVLILDSSRNTLRGNVVSGNGHAGVVVAGVLPSTYAVADLPPVTDKAVAATGNKLELNFIGTTLSGHAALANGSHAVLGTGGGVILLPGAKGNSIGDVRLGNTISGNAGSGVLLVGDPALAAVSGNLLAANNIGVALNGATALPNSGSGVHLTAVSANGIGSSPAQKNIIAFNRGDGVTVVSGKGNRILGNAIYNNRKLGINLVGGVQNAFGVTFNHTGSSSGPNGLQNFPEITQITRIGGDTFLEATLHSTPGQQFVIEFFSNETRDPSGYGQGRKSLGVTTVTTDAKGVGIIKAKVHGLLAATQTVSMTATGKEGTSEFSALPILVSGHIYHFVPDPSNPARIIKQGLAGVHVVRLEVLADKTKIQFGATIQTDAQGFYSFNAGPPGFYIILPLKQGSDFDFAFAPPGHVVTLPAPRAQSGSPDAVGIDFVTYSIGGLVKDAVGKPLAGVKVTLSGATKRTTVTNSAGRYLFDGLTDGNYTVSAGSGFAPQSQRLNLPQPGPVPSGVADFVRAAPSSQQAASGLLPRASSGLRLALGTRG